MNRTYYQSQNGIGLIAVIAIVAVLAVGGAVAYEVEGDIQGVIMCNCSICHRKGAPLWFISRGQMRFTKGEDALSTYTFNKHVIKHRFCPTCGIHTHGEAPGPGGAQMAAINLRTLEDFDLDSVPVKHFDGRSA